MNLCRSICVILLASMPLALAARGATAKPLPSLNDTLTARERALLTPEVMTRIGQLIATRSGDPSVLDELVAKDNDPTPFRGMMQMLRATFLNNKNQTAAAQVAVDEAVRLLPGYGQPLLVAAEVYTFSDQPGRAADYVLRLAATDADLAKQIPDYDLSALLMRLRAARENKRAEAVADKMLETGWVGENVASRSTLASEAIERRVRAGALEEARRLLPDLVVPGDSYDLLADKRFEALWPDLERWGGPKLERRWDAYLTEARARFMASKADENVAGYVHALNAAGDDKDMIADILPMFSGHPGKDDDELIFAVTGVADALARAGRWVEVEQLYAKADQIWPLAADNPNSLNIPANHARFLLFQGKPAEALAMMDETIATARQAEGGVNPDALAAMYSYRACMLHALGRKLDPMNQLALSSPALDPDGKVSAALCQDDLPAARAALISALANEETRVQAIALLQPPSVPPYDSDYCRRSEKRWEALRHDPAALQALERYGRVMPYAVNEAAKTGIKTLAKPDEQTARLPTT